MEIQQDVARRQFRIPKPTQHRADGDRADARTRLVNRCERNGQKTRVLDIVDAGHSNVFRHINFQVDERLEQMSRCENRWHRRELLSFITPPETRSGSGQTMRPLRAVLLASEGPDMD